MSTVHNKSNTLFNKSQSLEDKVRAIKAVSKVNPQREDGHVEICNSVYESLCRIHFRSPYTLPVIMATIRKTWGWNKKVDNLSLSQLVNDTGFYERAVIRALSEAEVSQILLIERTFGCPNKIAVNKHYDTWLTTAIKTSSTTDTGVRGTTDTGVRHKRHIKNKTRSDNNTNVLLSVPKGTSALETSKDLDDALEESENSKISRTTDISGRGDIGGSSDIHVTGDISDTGDTGVSGKDKGHKSKRKRGELK